ncbi:hypothetical protein BH11PSE8_BH11PSE8_07340 [soil metagenome]
MKFTLWRVQLCALGALAATAMLAPNEVPESSQASALSLQSEGAQQLPRGVQNSSWQAVLASTGR